ncbi:FAD-dependent monooxygenase [Mucilaginibacter sp. 21P]|uniref:FAD-dependent monooxygenase n=1 Tax=Mucilaginibacter sp. 21P TaxID=2778902 RepID=UPI001C572C3D|nr:FAD-dependent monooxygenase [Mucilaginibacter sp. 21P]QXV63776.1 FAD-dependent monooxygenase [Mucilaginibacter sp. 21P]
MKSKKILISGASIAGPTLAWWLSYYGFDVTIVERAPELRTGGYKIDLRGAAVKVIKRMGLYENIKDEQAGMTGAAFVNDKGKILARLPANLIGLRQNDDVELMRGDLSRIIYDDTVTKCRYLFNDSIATINEQDDQLTVTFKNSQSQLFDLVIGADGIHSHVRSLAFGPESAFMRNLGDYFFAIYSVPNFLKLDRSELFYAKADRVCNLYSTRNSADAKALFIFRSPGFDYDYRNQTLQKDRLKQTFADMGWEVPKVLAQLEGAPDFYLDTVQQVHMKAWSSGRVALLGDAAWAPSLASGQGSSMAIVGAYVLAGELFKAQGDHQTAYPCYETAMRPFIEKNQLLGRHVKQMVPSSNWRLRLQLMMLKLMPYLPMSNLIIKKMLEEVSAAANGIIVPDYKLSALPKLDDSKI